ncbi:hypothetical protein CSKR_103538 [Clonorchis sinensis]|uniref:Uncharacterized protein n=1 Tax=Clonorchis sinensis TaxID=79923 RepID=A0A3R7CDY1_CLOSI|nr:hypothetical protein CSKR_103538 [Clonorchis sinensis]
MPPEGSTRAGILPGCPSLDRGIREAEVRRNPTSAFGLLLSRLGQSGNSPTLVPPSVGMAARHREGATAERLFIYFFAKDAGRIPLMSPFGQHLNRLKAKAASIEHRAEMTSVVFDEEWSAATIRIRMEKTGGPKARLYSSKTLTLRAETEKARYLTPGYRSQYFLDDCDVKEDLFQEFGFQGNCKLEVARCLKREFAHRKVCGSNPTFALGLFPSSPGQTGSISALMLNSDGVETRHRKDATAERFDSTRLQVFRLINRLNRPANHERSV